LTIFSSSGGTPGVIASKMSGPDLHQCATFQPNPYSSDGDVSQPDRQTDRQTHKQQI